MMLTFTAGASHTFMHCEHYGEGILSDLSSVRIKFLADDLQRGRGDCWILLALSHWGILHHLWQNFFSDPPHIKKQKQQLCNNYYVLSHNAYCSAILFEYTNSRLTTENNTGMNEDYRLLGCKTMQLVDVLEKTGPPSFRSQGVRLCPHPHTWHTSSTSAMSSMIH
jgi:hypothetical protein